jgi:hypothetical protein
MRKLFGKVAVASVLLFAAMPRIAMAQDQAAPADASSLQTALPSDVDPNSPLAQIIHLAQSGVDESVLTSYAGNSPTPFNLTADQIIYLKDIGVPDTVVQAMIQRDQQLGVTDNTTASTEQAPDTAPPTGEVTSDYFYGALAPYGGWVNVSGYGLCWRPSAVTYNSGWQPYCDHGHWIDTDDGWYWTSDYSWGWATFHYGRWFRDPQWGWCWWPDTTWGPSWVCWRSSDSYCGWAPLPPAAVFQPGVGIVFNGEVVGAGFDFGISANFFTFVPTASFCDPHPGRFRVAAAQVPGVYRQTAINNNFEVHNNDFVNRGIDPQRISALTHTTIRPVAIQEASTPVMRGEAMGGNQTLVINRPHFTGTAVTTMHQGYAPRPTPQENTTHAWYVTQPAQNVQHPQTVNENVNRPAPQNYQRPASSQPTQTWFAPQPTHEAQPVERAPQYQAPERAPVVNEPVERTAPENTSSAQTPYRENEEPTPEYNDSQGQRYTSPRSEEQSPRPAPTQTYSAPVRQSSPPQQQRPQQGQQQGQGQNKNGY